MITGFARHQDVLASGLRLVTVELPHLHSASVVMYARVGSRYEDASDNGLSHFLEHMLFRGTARYPDAYRINYAIEALGGTLYAETGRDYSLYQLSLHPETLAEGISLMGEIFTAPAFRDIDIERRILLEELLEDLDEKGRVINVGDLARQSAYPDHPLGYSITGPYANVERFTLGDVQRHFERCYGARNMLLCVSGAVRRDEVRPQVERAFTGLRPGAELHSATPPARPGGARFLHVPHTGTQTSVDMLFRALPESSPDYPALIALSRVLDDGMSTRLHHRVCDELGLAYYVSASLDSFSDASLFELDASSAHANVPALVRESLALLDELRTTPPSPAELTKAKRRYRWDVEASFDDPDSMAGWFGGVELYYPAPSFEEKIARMEAVTPEDVSRVARAIFTPEHLTVATVGQLDGAIVREVKQLVTNFR
ncbi:MAG TPA: pitrilysin family protein [Polyangia bacterium]|jgi:predicted Zn-dependent peptidase|nr:pitrilysin family protein [Polyangia bacterium]